MTDSSGRNEMTELSEEMTELSEEMTESSHRNEKLQNHLKK